MALRPTPCCQGLHLVPGCVQPVILPRRNGKRLGKPVRILRPFAHQPQRTGIVRAGSRRRRFQLAIGFVDQDQIGNLHDAALDPLQLVAARRGEKQDEEIAHLGNHGLGLPDPHGFDQHNIEPRRLAQSHRLAGPPRDATEMGQGRRGPDKRAWLAAEPLHPGFVAQNRAARPC